jgi:hypothetical protein
MIWNSPKLGTTQMKRRENRIPAKPRENRTRSSQVPEQFFGYSLQAIRFLHLLLEAPPGTLVSLEVFEDVGALAPNGGTVASQVKSGLVKNPLTDRSIDLWKTIANWVSAVEAGNLEPSTTIFEIYVTRHRCGTIASAFHNAHSEAEALAAIEAARATLRGNGKTPRKLGNELAAYVSHVFDSDQAQLVRIILNLRISTARRDPLADLRPLVETKWVRPESIDLVIQHAHGWLKERLDGLLHQRKPAIIADDDFIDEMRKFMPRCDFRQIVVNMAGPPTPEQIAAERVKTYVRQLELIELEEEGTLEAINNYLRATVMRTKLSEDGIVHDDSFKDFEEALTSFWRNKRRQNHLTYPTHSEIQRGQLLFSDCCLHRQKLQGLELPEYFTPGSFQALADEMQIGWHPTFETALKEAAK